MCRQPNSREFEVPQVVRDRILTRPYDGTYRGSFPKRASYRKGPRAGSAYSVNRRLYFFQNDPRRQHSSIQSTHFAHCGDLLSCFLHNLWGTSVFCVRFGPEILVLTVRAERMGKVTGFFKARCLAGRLHSPAVSSRIPPARGESGSGCGNQSSLRKEAAA